MEDKFHVSNLTSMFLQMLEFLIKLTCFTYLLFLLYLVMMF